MRNLTSVRRRTLIREQKLKATQPDIPPKLERFFQRHMGALRVLEFVAILSALGGLYFAINDNQMTRSAIEDQRIATAWETLSRKSSGNSGKVDAIQYLISKDVRLFGIDVSCRAMNGGWDDKDFSCDRPTHLWGLDLSSAAYKADPESVLVVKDGDFSGTDLTDSTFERTRLGASIFSGADLERANFSGADLWGATFKSAWGVESNFSRAFLLNSNFSSSVLGNAKFEYSFVRNSNFSDTIFNFASLKNMNASSANFERSRLELSDLRDANLTFANLTEAILVGTNLSGADVMHAQFQGAFVEETIFCEGNDCVLNLSAEQLATTWAYEESWNPHSLPDYLKVGPEIGWPHPNLCSWKASPAGERNDLGIPRNCLEGND